MECLAIVDSGNYAYQLCRILERQGFVFEVVSTPCQIAREGCGYCLKFPIEYKDLVVMEGARNNIAVRNIYKIIPMATRNKYERLLEK